jgi:hypothetical protein
VAVLVLLSLGLGAMLLLNTLLAQGSFALHSLEAQVADLADREQELRQRAAELAAPQRLERRAREMGMVPSSNPAFLRSQDGKVLGVPIPATAPVPVVGSTTTEPDAGSDAGSDEDSGNASGRDAQNQQDQKQQDQNQKQDQQDQKQQAQDQKQQAQDQKQQAQDQQDGGGTG